MSRRRPSLPLLGALVALVVGAAGLTIRHTVGGLGTASPPWVMDWAPDADLWLLPSLVLAGVFAWAGPRATVPAATALAALFGLAVNAIGFGTAGWSRVFDVGPDGSFEAKNEYLPSLPVLEYGERFLLDRFAELVPTLAPNAGAHPPGMLLVLHWTGIDTAEGMAALCIAAAVACVPATWWLARTAGVGLPAARIAAVLCASCPVLLLYGITSADAVYALAATVAAALLVDRRTVAVGAGCVVLAVITLFSWALLAAGAYAAVLVWARDGWRPALRLAAATGVAVLAWFALLAAWVGYDAIGVLRATDELYRGSVRTERPLWFWALGSPVAWGTMLGAAVAGGWLAGVQRRRPEALALGVVVVVASLAGFTAAETERIWLPFVPMACVAAGAALPRRWLRAGIAAAAAQTVVIAALFETVW